MLTKEQINNNLLIARYSDLIECSEEYQMKWLGMKDVTEFQSFKARHLEIIPLFYRESDPTLPYFIDTFNYHESFDSLKPIIEKIVNSGCIFEVSFCFVTSCRICVINGKREKAFNIIHENDTNVFSVEPIYLAIVEYINYKNNKK